MSALTEKLQARVAQEVERYNDLNEKVGEAEQRVLALREARTLALGSAQGAQEMLSELLAEESLAAGTNGHVAAEVETRDEG